MVRVRHGLLAMAAVVAAAASTATPDVAEARVKWSAGFESRSMLGGWNLRWARSGGVKRVRKPVRQGRYAMRFVVRPGDEPGNSGERSELAASPEATAGYEGTESWYGWSTYFPTRFNPTLDGFNVFVQFHHIDAPPGCVTGSNVSFRTSANTRPMEIEVQVAGGTLANGCEPIRKRFTLGVLRRERWYDFAARVRWSRDPARGELEVWVNGKPVLPTVTTATLYDDHGVYVKQGLYRKRSDRVTTIYHDAMRRGATRADVTLRRRR